jgi:hypothetical protein
VPDEEVDEVVANALKGMEEHNRRMEALAEHYVGKNALAHGRSIPDPWVRTQWYANRIYDLGTTEGTCKAGMRRCKRTDSPTYQKYEKIGQDVQHVRDHLILEMLQIQ